MSAHDLTQGRVSGSLARLTAPMMAGVSSSILVQMLELGFIGQLSTAHVAAITFTFPMVMVLTSIALGISIGTSSVIARSVGNRQVSAATGVAQDRGGCPAPHRAPRTGTRVRGMRSLRPLSQVVLSVLAHPSLQPGG